MMKYVEDCKAPNPLPSVKDIKNPIVKGIAYKILMISFFFGIISYPIAIVGVVVICIANNPYILLFGVLSFIISLIIMLISVPTSLLIEKLFIKSNT